MRRHTDTFCQSSYEHSAKISEFTELHLRYFKRQYSQAQTNFKVHALSFEKCQWFFVNYLAYIKIINHHDKGPLFNIRN